MTSIFSTGLRIGVDEVIRGQGMDPEAVRTRSPRLISFAEDAIRIGSEKICPRVAYQVYRVNSQVHDRFYLGEGRSIRCGLASTYLGMPEQIIIAVCTIGSQIQDFISESFISDPGKALALEGYATASIAALANAFCRYIEDQAKSDGKTSSLPIHPGMEAWSVDQGQPQIFQLVDASQIGVHLSPSCVMLPLKSLSMVIGIGGQLSQGNKPCDLCSMQMTCKYREKAGLVII